MSEAARSADIFDVGGKAGWGRLGGEGWVGKTARGKAGRGRLGMNGWCAGVNGWCGRLGANG
jgi:hypothetical protein